MDKRNFNHFVEEHFASLTAIAKKFVGSDAVAKDIAQDVIIKFWESPASAKKKINSISDYLFVMTKNHSLNYVRGKRRQEERD